MKKMYKRITGVLIILIGIILVGHTAFIVQARDSELEEDPIAPVTQQQCDIVRAEDYYKPNVTISDDINANYFTVSVNTGVFDVYVYEIVVDGTNVQTTLKNSIVLGSEGNNRSAQVNFTKGSAPINYEVVFSLKESDTICGVTEGSYPVRDSNGAWGLNTGIGYVYYHQVEIPANIANTSIININYDGICAALRYHDETAYNLYSSQFAAAGLSKDDFLAYGEKAYNSDKFTYCRSETVDMNYKESEVAMLIRNTIAGIKISELGTTGTLNGPPVSEGLTIVDGSTDLSNTPIQCPAYQTINGAQVPNQSSTTKQYYKTVTTETTMDIYSTLPDDEQPKCVKTCEETVTVTYGPPVASKAGLCFEYKVKVESELNCVTTFTGEEPKPSDYTVCTPVGSCNGGALRSASGPNEDFDNCVNSCDGGKYTQSCINSCYNEVYGASIPLSLNYSDKVIATNAAIYNKKQAEQLATNEEMQRYYAILSSSPEDIGTKYSYEELQTAVVEAGSGYYYVTNGVIHWKPGERYWEIPGRYYTVNILSYTVERLISHSSNCNSTWNQCGYSVVDKNDGFLRNNYGTSVCMAACAWTGCSTAAQNGYYVGYPSNPGTATNRQFLNYQDATDVYKQEFEKYEAAFKECKAAASCTSQTSEFTIKVNNKTNDDPEVDNWIDYQTSISEAGALNATTVNGTALSETSIILDRSGCYTPEENTGSVTYMTEWSFPGTWVNNKTGKISYQTQNDNAWHLKKEKFCTNLNSKYVNTAWWNQRILQPNTNVDDANKATIEEYNIIAEAKDFGYFKWNFEIDCFYAMYDSPIPDEGTSDEIAPLSYQTRTIDLTDMFPNNENEAVTTNPNETGREQGYNWTDLASNVKNASYEITPGALYPVIQARGNEIYDPANEDSYLDYEFYLTPSDLNRIRNYSKEAGDNFNNYLGKITVANGISYYESALFRNSGTSSYKLDASSIITLGALGVNNQRYKGSNEAETFTNSYTAILIQNRDEYLSYISGGNS